MRMRHWAGAIAVVAGLAVAPAASSSRDSFVAIDAQWSASGRLITFWNMNASRFWVMNADGSARRTLAKNVEGATALSPDGRLVADLELRPSVGGRLFLTTPSGRPVKHLTFGTDPADGFDAPQWSPNQRAIAWEADTERGDEIREEILVSNLANRVRSITGRRRAAPRDEAPAWSPDGRRIAFVAYDNRLTIMAPDGTHRTTIFGRARLPEQYLDPGPVWAPDGHAIAFAFRQGQEEDRARYSIYVVRPDGAGLRRVAVTPPVQVLRSLAWAPSSDRIAWSDTRGVVSVVVPSGRKQRLTYGNGEAEWVSWAPSARLVFTARGQIFTLAPGGRPVRVF